MREILFRGKNERCNEWIIGYYTEACASYCNGQSIIEDDYDDYIVITETVGQFTGLLDRNGTRIFEGDIVTVKLLRPHPDFDYTSFTGVVIWCGGAFEVEGVGNDEYTPYELLYNTCQAYREVIGNVHDNPELLERQ